MARHLQSEWRRGLGNEFGMEGMGLEGTGRNIVGVDGDRVGMLRGSCWNSMARYLQSALRGLWQTGFGMEGM